jgi:hypothetical protein
MGRVILALKVERLEALDSFNVLVLRWNLKVILQNRGHRVRGDRKRG